MLVSVNQLKRGDDVIFKGYLSKSDKYDYEVSHPEKGSLCVYAHEVEFVRKGVSHMATAPRYRVGQRVLITTNIYVGQELVVAEGTEVTVDAWDYRPAYNSVCYAISLDSGGKVSNVFPWSIDDVKGGEEIVIYDPF